MKNFLLTNILVLGFIYASSQSCLPEGIDFNTQAEIDSFQINYPECIEIEGDVEINGSDITNLNGLNVLTHIGGNLNVCGNDILTSLTGLENMISIDGGLIIGCYTQGNPALTSLEALAGVINVGGDLVIIETNSLEDLTGLEGVTSIGGNLQIWWNHSLMSLSGLNNLNTVGGDLSIGINFYGDLHGNPTLASLTGLGDLTSVGGGLEIIANNALTSLSGLEGLTSLDGLTIRSNNSLTSLTGLDNLTSLSSFYIAWNPITNFAGLDNLTSIGGSLYIGFNGLTNLAGLEGLISVGSVKIDRNVSLNDLTGLENLKTIGGRLEIAGNDALTNLTDLEGVYSIGESLVIKNNDVLTSLSGLDNINANSISDLAIRDNISLSICEVKSICDYLVAPNGYLIIKDNATGCYSPEEVLDSCEANAFNIDEQFIKDNLNLYPNPTIKEFNISLEGFSIDEVIIYTLTGQQVLMTRPKGESLDISNFHPGMYIVEVTVENRRIRQKLLVE